MTLVHNLGFPRIGPRRELKHALEAFWRAEIGEAELRAAGAELRRQNWQVQREAGVDLIPVGDFAWYDHVLTASVLFGNVPRRFGAGSPDLRKYFAMARGAEGVPAMEMTKWFDTNYHYIVPEFGSGTRFRLVSSWVTDEVREAQALGIRAKPVLLGPLTYLWLGKEKESHFDRLSLLPALLPLYRELLSELARLGVEWIQLDEPALALDLPPAWQRQIDGVFQTLADGDPKLLLATYFGGVGHLAPRLKTLPVAGLHLDLASAPEQLDEFLRDFPEDKVLSAGVIDGRNVWRCDLDRVFRMLAPVRAQLGDRLWLAPGCSLLHCPVSLAPELEMDHEIKGWLAFAREKLVELSLLKRGLTKGRDAIVYEIAVSNGARSSRALSRRTHNPAVTAQLATVSSTDWRRGSAFAQRQRAQQLRLGLPAFPTTTIGSFPQTPEIRRARGELKKGRTDAAEYRERICEQIRLAVRKQEALDLDVLVHGEAERNDMVEYFGELLEGFALTSDGWVQSYGSRCVKPPIVYGDVWRPRPMTVEWATYAQSLTRKPVKGMLTGPVTILKWSFARDDQPRSTTALQIALAIRAEVLDLERAGIGIIQIDEPALREGLPLSKSQWPAYFEWATLAFRVVSTGVSDETQIHTHMCYAEFADIMPAIASLDADVITVETSRSAMDLLDAFAGFQYPNAIGPGIYDIHSPRVPDTAEMVGLLQRARAVIPDERLWVNPDCGLKTRAWNEVDAALANMVAAAKALRREHATAKIEDARLRVEG